MAIERRYEMNIFEDRYFRYFVLFWVLVYGLLSIYGTLWIDDEFTIERQKYYTYFAIPSFILFYTVTFLGKQPWKNKSYRWSISLILLIPIMLWGNLLLLNIAGGEKNETFTNRKLAGQSIVLVEQRGAFGWIYRLRW
tara:strand:+ start:114 stop:527 length:414 start_codon:yes stop_codon:yes gene_type:complete